MGLSVGIVGLPNVGKSTLFNALLRRQQAMVANYPFATIEPNVGVVPVPDDRLRELALVVASESTKFEARNSKKVAGGGIERGGVRAVEAVDEKMRLPPEVPAVVEFIDIAGLVAGASKGEGLGNKFLANIREVDLIAHVVRDFVGGDIVQTGVSPKSDYETVTTELILKDVETVENKIRNSKSEIRNNTQLINVLNKLKTGFDEGKRAYQVLSAGEAGEVRDLCLLTMKPEMMVVNISEQELASGIGEGKRQAYAQMFGVSIEDVVVVSAKIESEIGVLADEDAKLFMDDLGMEESGLSRLITAAYGRLGLISFLTAGEIEVRAWTIRKGVMAPEAAGVIHTDFSQKFIKAEVCDFEDFVSMGGWKKCREVGKVRLEGRDYVVKDGDVIDFKIGS